MCTVIRTCNRPAGLGDIYRERNGVLALGRVVVLYTRPARDILLVVTFCHDLFTIPQIGADAALAQDLYVNGFP